MVTTRDLMPWGHICRMSPIPALSITRVMNSGPWLSPASSRPLAMIPLPPLLRGMDCSMSTSIPPGTRSAAICRTMDTAASSSLGSTSRASTVSTCPWKESVTHLSGPKRPRYASARPTRRARPLTMEGSSSSAGGTSLSGANSMVICRNV